MPEMVWSEFGTSYEWCKTTFTGTEPPQWLSVSLKVPMFCRVRRSAFLPHFLPPPKSCGTTQFWKWDYKGKRLARCQTQSIHGKFQQRFPKILQRSFLFCKLWGSSTGFKTSSARWNFNILEDYLKMIRTRTEYAFYSREESRGVFAAVTGTIQVA